MKKATKKSAAKDRYVIVGNGSWGLWYGHTTQTDAEISKTASVTLKDARHVRYWYVRNGGITSLAVWGLCGPRMAESRIGAPSPSSLVLDVKAVHECTPEAVATFAGFRCDNA